MKKKEIYRFVRFGGCSIKTQKGFKKNSKEFHSPPAPKGFYAMPFIAQEFFLISSLGTYQKGTLPKLKGDTSNWTNEQFDEFYKKEKKAISSMRKEFLKKEGNIWHHLEKYTPHYKILDTNGSWIKTSIKDWAIAFNKMSITLKAESMIFLKENSVKYNISFNSVNEITGFYSRDHCEVFFDEKV